ncbi:biopolymer transporter ExbD [Methylomonas sp. SURF-2]|uniref:Biopolymer transporter ExbD n=1 Tax=Methylomonas subterranea TaxID=2952225 RepID=A0ABT1TL12_9GAMM|nr:biopolymer transporter ExbD [Methylomonas sp. SURF-2]MCQ8105439.1 biopolymer transporter ExbD [Methylomonas sp. SURF-2]
MAFGGFDQHKTAGHTVAEINMIPLIDVMLVLLVIFMITAPMMTHAVKIDLPQANSQPQTPLPVEPVNLSIDNGGQLFWNQEAVSREQLRQKLAQLSSRPDSAELHVRADKGVAYHIVAETLADATQAGVSRIGFVSEPESSKP